MSAKIQTTEHKDPCRFLSYLSSSFFELLLIILLFTHALLSYLVHKFANYCKLPTPCILCSRLDRSRPYFYKELICNNHKLEISSLAYCRTHQRLANGDERCNECKVGEILGNGLSTKILSQKFHDEDTPLLEKETESGSLSKSRCSCCSMPLRNRDELAKGTENRCRALAIYNGDAHCFEQLPHIGYNELKITSDTESEIPLSERGDDDVKQELLSRCLQAAPEASFADKLTHVTSDDTVLEKLVYPSPIAPDTSIVVPKVEAEEKIPVSSDIRVAQVQTEGLITKLDVPSNGSIVSNGDSIKALSSSDKGLRISQIKYNERLLSDIKVPLASPSSELVKGRESSKISEDFKARLSQISTPSWLDFPWNEMSSTPIVNTQVDESKLFDTFKSLDESFISEIEGESAIDRLKRQIEMDRKSMSVLYKELEEERNASAIAVNQAMAMINKLQEEKAAMQMDALQYLRMMEEQAEFDQEDIQKLNRQLTDREKEIQDLEAHIESYRKWFGDESIFDCEEREYKEYTPVTTPRVLISKGLDFEEEKVYISECLKRLEKMLKLYSSSGDLKESSQKETNNISKRDITPPTEDSDVTKSSLPSTLAVQLAIKEAIKESKMRSSSYNGRHIQMSGKKNDIIALESEISELRMKLEAIEEDRKFIEHAVSSLKDGSNGVQLIEEIACHLRELRKIAITPQELLVVEQS